MWSNSLLLFEGQYLLKTAVINGHQEVNAFPKAADIYQHIALALCNGGAAALPHPAQSIDDG